MKKNASLIYDLFLVVGDFLALALAFVGAYLIRSRLYSVPVAHPIPAGTYLGIFLALLPFWLLIFALLGLYNGSIYEKRFSEIGRLFIGSFVGMLFVMSYAYTRIDPVFPSKMVPVYAFLLSFGFLVIFRTLARAIRSWMFKYDIGITNLLIVGNTKIAQELVEALADSKISGYRIVGVVGNKSHSKDKYPDIPVFDDFDEAVEKIPTDDIHSIVQTELFVTGERNNKILEFALTNHVSYRFVPGNSELFVGNITVELFRSSIPVIAVHQTALIGWGRIVKRLSDIVLGGLFLIIASPFMLVIGLLIKLSDLRAPVFFKDSRLTRFGHKTKIYKFRSHTRAYSGLTPEQAFSKMGRPDLIEPYRRGGDQIPDDPRVSRIGKFLRKTSLDELPQLLNVVKGDISLVGPRALQVDEWKLYSQKDLILAVKSGLTGLAQVSGRRDIPSSERRKLDLYYVQNWNLWMDMVIIVKTFRLLVNRIGAK
ncbi:MAG TPA: sugar transferase [Candidatus Binatia bacterium]|nr:sugar transferase [Candidatus Binatia bacterium]